MSKIEFTLVVPCYNEAVILEANIGVVREVLDAARWAYEIIFIDDGSSDGTRGIIDRLVAASEGKMRSIFHLENRGRGAAVDTGIRAAAGKFVGFIDIDLEVHACYIPACILELERGADMVIGHRIYKFSLLTVDRYVMSKGYRRLVRGVLGIPNIDTESGYKFFRRAAILHLLDQVKEPGWFWDTEIVVRALRAGLRIEQVYCLFVRRREKDSTVRGIRDSIYYFKKLMSFRSQK